MWILAPTDPSAQKADLAGQGKKAAFRLAAQLLALEPSPSSTFGWLTMQEGEEVGEGWGNNYQSPLGKYFLYMQQEEVRITPGLQQANMHGRNYNNASCRGVLTSLFTHMSFAVSFVNSFVDWILSINIPDQSFMFRPSVRAQTESIVNLC